MEKDGVVVGVYSNNTCLCIGQIVNGEIYVQQSTYSPSSISYSSTNKEWTITNPITTQATIYAYELD